MPPQEIKGIEQGSVCQLPRLPGGAWEDEPRRRVVVVMGKALGASEGHPRPKSPHPLRAGMGTQPPRAGGRIRTGEVRPPEMGKCVYVRNKR